MDFPGLIDSYGYAAVFVGAFLEGETILALAAEVVAIGDVAPGVDGSPAESDAALPVDHLYRRQEWSVLEQVLKLRTELVYIDRSGVGSHERIDAGRQRGERETTMKGEVWLEH